MPHPAPPNRAPGEYYMAAEGHRLLLRSPQLPLMTITPIPTIPTIKPVGRLHFYKTRYPGGRERSLRFLTRGNFCGRGLK
ncbi:MAG TPA: hypothetical protein VKT25_02210, partial [Ktedonobacteraceae bacterium]|nr:hypothetical protein [Ktedonobacteraceae bacterium]